MRIDWDCVFCQIMAGAEPPTIVRRWELGLAIVPINPVVAGHTLVIPSIHVRDVGQDPEVTALSAGYVAELVADLGSPCNVITSVGREATQSVFHLHWHVIPRADNDGLALPWYSGRRRRTRVLDRSSTVG